MVNFYNIQFHFLMYILYIQFVTTSIQCTRIESFQDVVKNLKLLTDDDGQRPIAKQKTLIHCKK